VPVDSRVNILNWKNVDVGQFGQIPMCIEHALHKHELFSEARLAHLLESAGRGDYYVNTMDLTAHNSASRREGEMTGLTGTQILEAVKNGQIWILLLHPYKSDPAYQALLNDIYAEVASKVPGFHATHLKTNILISSPNIQVYYHCDIPGQSLWQVQGHKRVYVYPNKEPYLNQPSLEKIAMGEAHEISLPYDPGFDEHATVYDLQPGQMLHWPLNSPHRIVNGNCMNVSFTTEHFTPAIRRMFHVNYANGVLRQRLGLTNLEQRITGPVYWGKLGVAAAYKLTGGQHKHRKTLCVDFAVDPHAPHGVRSIPAHDFRR
jgi:hypothetical protein